MKVKRAVVLIAVLTLICALPAFAQDKDVPKNVILLIGDGMGVSHVSTGRIEAEKRFNLERFKVMGLVSTHSVDEFVTDSAAAGTALATGVKTLNGAVSVSRRGKPLKTVLEHAESRGKKTGIVVSCSVTHATPAAFMAHAKNRDEEPLIAEQIVGSGVDVLLGGGWSYFIPQSADNSKRKDEKNLIEDLRQRMRVVRRPHQLYRLKKPEAVAGLFYDNQPPKAAEKREPRLSYMAKKAIEILSGTEAGFFMMVEGSQIDWAAHEKNKGYIVGEMLDFDAAVGECLDFAMKNGETLVVVTADHETGGLALLKGSIRKHRIEEAGFATAKHTAAMVPLFAYGPGAEAFGGIADNTSVGKKLIEYVTTYGVQSSE